jgi:hypothetical protein
MRFHSIIRRAVGLLLILVCLSSLPGCDVFSPCKDGPTVRVLFIGNSYTYVNDLPATFRKLACSGGHKVETGMAASGGWTLSDHVSSPDTQKAITGQAWDYVILQEQSETPTVPYWRETGMYPAVRSLVNTIADAGAEPILLLTWGHRDGLPEQGLNTYAEMQSALETGYDGIAGQLHIRVAPVGRVWRQAVDQELPLDLWQSDGSHPQKDGAYLAASVLYAELFAESPAGLSYGMDLPQPKVDSIQSLVANYYKFSQ